ncbi:hypothetical protein ACGFI3_31720 [Nonomuraea wenchangensis]|uniref:DUF7715 family protein n=1 Tax=Nonomuraea wenchangensis TaxID=568860 RepID=UPI00371F2918
MLVLAAPHGDDPRDDGYNHAIPGELLYRPFICDSGQQDNCGCERSWVGTGSSKATTLAEVVDMPDMTRADYLATIGLYLMDMWGWEAREAYQEAQDIAGLAEHYGAGALVTIDRTGHDHLDASHG